MPERRHWCRSGVFIVNFERISHLVPVFLLLTFAVRDRLSKLFFGNDTSEKFIINIVPKSEAQSAQS